jgi:hypothetical protein
MELLQTSRHPRIVPFVYEALGHRDLRPAACRLVSEQTDETFMAEVVKWAFLIADGRIRRGVASIHNLAWLARSGQPILRLPPELYPRAVNLVLATTIVPERKVVIFRDLLHSNNRAAQRAGLWGLVSVDNDLSTQLIRSVVQWEDPELAGVALREMLRRHPEELKSVLPDPTESQSPTIREVTGEPACEYTFDEFWQSFDMLEGEERLRVGKALLNTTKEFLPQLRKKLAGARSSDRLRAIQVISKMKIAESLKEEIYRVAYDHDPFVRSSAMSLLGHLPGPTSERILLNGLNDPEKRVQANSIESLERLRATIRFEEIRRHLHSEDNRTRANAVKALWNAQSREAASILLEMLRHDLPAQRASALWVVESLELMSLAAQVLRLAKHDPDANVRRRAVRAVAALQTALRDPPNQKASPEKDVQEVAS